MKVTVSRFENWNVVNYYGTYEFEVPDSMVGASDEEIVKYLVANADISDLYSEMEHDKWKGPREEFVVESRD